MPARQAAPRAQLANWKGWRGGLLLAAASLGLAGLILVVHALAQEPTVSARWQWGAHGQIQLQSSNLAVLGPHQGKGLEALVDADSTEQTLDPSVADRSERWLIDDAARARHRTAQERLAHLMAQPSLTLKFADGSRVEVPLQKRGFAGFDATFWLLCGLALLLYVAALVVVIAQPTALGLLYAVASLCQIGNLLFIAIESVPSLAILRPLPAWGASARMAFDLVTAAAALHAASLAVPGQFAARRIALTAWVAVGVLIATEVAGHLSHAWWWAQGGVFVLCAVAIYLLGRPPHGAADPSSAQLRRLGVVALGAWVLLTLSLAAADRVPGLQRAVLSDAAVVWYVFLAVLLALVPLLSRSPLIVHEFALLATISAVAASLDLLFASYFSLGRFAALTLAVFLSLAVYSGVRHWILHRFLGTRRLTTERMFEQLYRIAREAEINPQRVLPLLLQLLTDLFEPLQAEAVEGRLMSTRVMDAGSTLLVPVPLAGDGRTGPLGTIRLRFAQRGRRDFALEDAHLTDRIVEQLRRVVAFDRAVEQGRTEERLRLAQDLHDDIGARLLTLMYKAQSPEVEEYVRHTLKDLKTLTRGLAASNHPLSHATAEWKADLTQRLTAADIELGWTSVADRDLVLTMVQWSALTRILRELVSNAIAHARARRVEVAVQLAGDCLSLSVSDNGCGRMPEQWSHGLGLGGVRKRVKQLGGEVEWRDAAPSGVVCSVRVRLRPGTE